MINVFSNNSSFFIRLVDQFDFGKEQLDIYINRFSNLSEIKFDRIGGGGYFKYKRKDNEDKREKYSEIVYEIDYLKDILLGKKNKKEKNHLYMIKIIKNKKRLLMRLLK